MPIPLRLVCRIARIFHESQQPKPPSVLRWRDKRWAQGAFPPRGRVVDGVRALVNDPRGIVVTKTCRAAHSRLASRPRRADAASAGLKLLQQFAGKRLMLHGGCVSQRPSFSAHSPEQLASALYYPCAVCRARCHLPRSSGSRFFRSLALASSSVMCSRESRRRIQKQSRTDERVVKRKRVAVTSSFTSSWCLAWRRECTNRTCCWRMPREPSPWESTTAAR